MQRLLDPHSTLSASSPPPHRPHGAITGVQLTAGSSLNSLCLFSASSPASRSYHRCALTAGSSLNSLHLFSASSPASRSYHRCAIRLLDPSLNSLRLFSASSPASRSYHRCAKTAGSSLDSLRLFSASSPPHGAITGQTLSANQEPMGKPSATTSPGPPTTSSRPSTVSSPATETMRTLRN